MKSFKNRVSHLNLSRQQTKILQINLGKLCNLACTHCHVGAGPSKKRENMTPATVDRLLQLVEQSSISCTTVDLTGGAPELNSNFRRMVTHFRSLNWEVIDRCNLTVLLLREQYDLAGFLAAHQVRIVASLPCYEYQRVDGQRGQGVYEGSIEALKILNKLGYGRDPSLVLDLVYNPTGPVLPPPQQTLEEQYRKILAERFDLSFNQLFCISNMPIKRFRVDLVRQKQLDRYQQLLVDRFSDKAAENVMCRHLISVSWDGKIFDCDFNQALGIPMGEKGLDIWSIEDLADIHKHKINFADHCFGCTAGSGSSCTGATV